MFASCDDWALKRLVRPLVSKHRKTALPSRFQLMRRQKSCLGLPRGFQGIFSSPVKFLPGNRPDSARNGKKYDNGDLKCPPLDFYIAEPKRSKSRSDFQGNEGPSTLGRTFIDVSLSFDRLPFNLSGISGELFEHFESAVDSFIKYARLRPWLIYADVTLLPHAGNPCGSTPAKSFFKRPRNSFHSNDAFVSDKSRSMSRLETVWPSACTKFKINH